MARTKQQARLRVQYTPQHSKTNNQSYPLVSQSPQFIKSDSNFILSGKNDNGVFQNFKMLKCSYDCDVINQILRTQIYQEFQNDGQVHYKEAKYQIMITDNMCLEKFSITINGKTINGTVVSLDEAEQNKGQIESEGENTLHAIKSNNGDYIQITLGAIAPNDQISISILFSSIVTLVFTQYFRLLIPLMEPGMKEAFDSLKLKINCTGKITKAECISNHLNKAIANGEREINLVLTRDDLTTDQKSFEYIYSFEGMYEPSTIFGEVQKSIFQKPGSMKATEKMEIEDEQEIENYDERESCLISFTPDFGFKNRDVIERNIQDKIKNGENTISEKFIQEMEKDILSTEQFNKTQFFFVLDRSGSMSSCFNYARDTLIEFLDRIPEDSYFNVVSFGSLHEFLFDEAQKKNTKSIMTAKKLINEFSANMGGTEIYQPLKSILDKENVNDLYQMQIFLLTDGQVEKKDDVVNLICNYAHKTRLHCIGIGNGVDREMMRRCAEVGRGSNKHVQDIRLLKDVVISVLEDSFTPSFIKFQVFFDDSIADSVYPTFNELPSVLKNEQFFFHIFLKKGIKLNELTPEQRKVKIYYYDCFRKDYVKLEISLESNDAFSQNVNLKNSIFLLGKYLELNRLCCTLNLSQKQNDQVIEESIQYQLVTHFTSYVSYVKSKEKKKPQQKSNERAMIPDLNQSPKAPAKSSIVVVKKKRIQKTKPAVSQQKKLETKKISEQAKVKNNKQEHMSKVQLNEISLEEFNNDVVNQIVKSHKTDTLWSFDKKIIQKFTKTEGKLQEMLGYFSSVSINKDLLMSIIFLAILEKSNKKNPKKQLDTIIKQSKQIIEENIKRSYISLETAKTSLKKYINLSQFI